MAKKNPKSKAKVSSRRPSTKVTAETVFEFLRLTRVRLISVESSLQIKDGKVPVHAQILAQPNAGATPDGTRINANVMLEVVGRPEGVDKTDDCSTVKINAQYQCVYEVHRAKISAVVPFSEVIANTAMYVTWPYLRELCNSLTLKMGIPPITLPMLAPPQTSSDGLKMLRELETKKPR